MHGIAGYRSWFSPKMRNSPAVGADQDHITGWPRVAAHLVTAAQDQPSTLNLIIWLYNSIMTVKLLCLYLIHTTEEPFGAGFELHSGFRGGPIFWYATRLSKSHAFAQAHIQCKWTPVQSISLLMTSQSSLNTCTPATGPDVWRAW